MFEGMFVTSVLKCRQLWCIVTLVEPVLCCEAYSPPSAPPRGPPDGPLPPPSVLRITGRSPPPLPSRAPRLYPLCLTQKKERLPLSPGGLTSGGKMLSPSVEDPPPPQRH